MKKYIHIPNQKSGDGWFFSTPEQDEQEKQKKLTEKKLRERFNKK